MRKILFGLICICTHLFGQEGYPKLYVDSMGNEFVIMTIVQAQKLDNATEFSPSIFKEASKYNEMVDSLNRINKVLVEVKIDSILREQERCFVMMENMAGIIEDQKSYIEQRNSRINFFEENDIISDFVIERLTDKVNSQDKQIKSLKTSVWVSVGFVATAIVSGFLMGN